MTAVALSRSRPAPLLRWRSGSTLSWGVPLLLPVQLRLFRTATGYPIWTLRSSVITSHWSPTSALHRRLAAWVGSREGHRQPDDLLATTARPAWTRQLCSFGGTLAWVLAAYLAGAAAVYVKRPRRRPGPGRRSGRSWSASWR